MQPSTTGRLRTKPSPSRMAPHVAAPRLVCAVGGAHQRQERERAAEQDDVGRVHRGDAGRGDDQAAQRGSRRERQRLVGGGEGDGARKDVARHKRRQERRPRGTVEGGGARDDQDDAVEQHEVHGACRRRAPQHEGGCHRHELRDPHDEPAVVRVGQRPGHEDETERRQELHHADQPEMEGGAGEREDVPGHPGAHHRHGGGRAEAAGEVCHDGAGSEDGRHARVHARRGFMRQRIAASSTAKMAKSATNGSEHLRQARRRA